MRRWQGTVLIMALFGVAFSVTSGGAAWANNQWSSWHWGTNTIGVHTHPGGYWGTILSSELNDWDQGSCVSFTSGNGIHTDAGFYGINGWLGIARILDFTPSAEILECEALMNQSYLDDGTYSEINHRHVTCQEIGHCLGLDHRKGRSSTCMNDRSIGFVDFDQHDADIVASITVGCDSGGGGGGGCTLAQKGEACSAGSDCCSGICKRNGTCR